MPHGRQRDGAGERIVSRGGADKIFDYLEVVHKAFAVGKPQRPSGPASRRVDRLDVLVDEIVAAGGEAICIGTDVTVRADLTALVALAHERFGRLDVLVSNAGIGPVSRFDALCVDDWEAMINVNIKGVLYGIAAALPIFRQQGTGHFVHVVSTSGLKILPGQGV